MDVPHVVAPGAEVSFNFDVTAPSVPGFYNFQWRMVQDGVEWFGEYTPATLIDVYSASYCDWSEEQDCYYEGASGIPIHAVAASIRAGTIFRQPPATDTGGKHDM